MKTKIFYFAAFAFILSSLLSSCSFLQKEEFAQRKYYDFPRTKHSAEARQTEHASVSSPQTVTEKITAKEETTLPEEKTVTASASKKEIVAAKKEKELVHPSRTIQIIHSSSELKTETPVTSLKRKDIFKLAQKKTIPSASNSDAMLIIEIILAVLIPPLGVLLKGGKLGKWFWITLLLWIFSGGIWFIGYVGGGGVLWLIAAIIALCYVFGLMRD